MRIGFFTDGFLPQPNGVATSVVEAANELERRGHEVFIIAPKYPGFVDKNVRVIRLTSLKVASKPEIRMALHLPDQALRKILSMDFDVIHGHSGGPVTLIGWEIARRKKIPYVVTYHTLWNRYTHYFLKGKVVTPKMMERATKIFGNGVDYLVAPTAKVEKELRSYGVKKPIKVVPSGVDVGEFSKAKKGFLRSLTHLEDEPILLYVGRLGEEKSVDFLIKSFKEILEREKNTHLVIVGDGPDRKKLEAQSRKLKVDKNTHFLGDIDKNEMFKIYKDATVFVFASTSETQGLVFPEALASGVPVVAVSDPAAAIEDSKNGFIVRKDPSEFALKTLAIIKNTQLRREMSENAIETSGKFSVKATIDLLEPVYFELLERYNKESVTRVMSACQKNERTFAINLIFWATVLSTRLLTFFTYHVSSYPHFTIGGQSFSHSTVGIVFVLIFLALVFKNRKSGIFSLLFLGIGLGFIMDEGWSLFAQHATIADYWNPLNLIPILIFGIVPLFLFKVKLDDRAKFYINTREQKHVNPENPKVSVVVPAYNEGEYITPTLKSLLNQTYKNFELIVVDNNSTDNTAEVASRYGARIVKQEIKGVAAARQKGFFEARGEIIASTDADSVVPENWLAEIVRAYEKNKKLSGFGGLNALYSGPVTARAAGRYLFPLFWRIDKIINNGWNMAGFNMSVRKSSFIEIGGFNSELKMGEDIDLAKKLRTVGSVEIDTNLLVFSSGRRFNSGLFSGLMAYAPWWISTILLKQDKPFEFANVRSEKTPSSTFVYLPLGISVCVLIALFYAVAH